MSISLTQGHIQPFLLKDGASIITTVTNHGYLFYTMNMLKSLAPFGLDKKVFIVSIDKKGSQTLRRMGYEPFCIEDNTLGSFCPWNTKGYDKICYLKLELLYRILSLHTNVLLVDGDVVFQKNPLVDLEQWWSDSQQDVWVQNDSLKNENTVNMCTGYMYLKSSRRLIKLYDCVSDAGKKKYETCAFDNNDQSYFNEFVKPHCRMKALPLEQYPNGKMYAENKSTIQHSTVLVHFNWVKGHLKMAKMKEHKMWLLTPEEEEELV